MNSEVERSAQAPPDDLSPAARIAGGEPPNADGSLGQILGIEAVQVALRAARCWLGFRRSLSMLGSAHICRLTACGRHSFPSSSLRKYLVPSPSCSGGKRASRPSYLRAMRY